MRVCYCHCHFWITKSQDEFLYVLGNKIQDRQTQTNFYLYTLFHSFQNSSTLSHSTHSNCYFATCPFTVKEVTSKTYDLEKKGKHFQAQCYARNIMKKKSGINAMYIFAMTGYVYDLNK